VFFYLGSGKDKSGSGMRDKHYVSATMHIGIFLILHLIGIVAKLHVLISVSDPDSLIPDPDPAF
jgi:hypothetical protein